MAKFSRQHYIVLAQALKRAHETNGEAGPDGAVAFDAVALALASALARDNRNFNRDRFFTNAGLDHLATGEP